MKLKKKEAAQEQRTEKITLSGKTAALLDEYGRYYESVYHEKISVSDLMIEMIDAFIKSDRDFMRGINTHKNKNTLEKSG